MKQKTKLSRLFLNNQFLLSLYSLWFWLFSLFQLGVLPQVWPDEVLFFSPSESLFHHQTLTTPVLTGLIPGMETKTLWMPPAFFIFQSFFFHLVPPSLEAIRLFSLLVSYCSVLLFYFVLKELKFSRIASIIGFLSIITEIMFFRFGNSARMEGLTAFFFLSSLFVLLKFESKYSLSYFLSGFLFSLSVLSHPFALSFGLVTLWLGFLYFGFRWQRFIFFGIGFLLPLFAWLFYIAPDWDLFRIQFGAQLIRKKTLFAHFTFLTKVNIFLFGFGWMKARFLWFFVFFALLSSIAWNGKNKEFRENRLWLALIWMCSLLFAIYSSTEGYYVYHFLFPMALGIALLVEHRFTHFSLLSFIISLGATFYFLYIHWIQINTDQVLKKQVQHLALELKDQKNVYLQALPDPYFSLRKILPNLELLEFIPGELEFPSDEYKSTLKKQDAFVVYDSERLNPVISNLVGDAKIWTKVEWEIPVPKEHWYHFKTTIYKKNVSY